MDSILVIEKTSTDGHLYAWCAQLQAVVSFEQGYIALSDDVASMLH